MPRRGPIRSVNEPVTGALSAPTAVLIDPMIPNSKRLRENSAMNWLAKTTRTNSWKLDVTMTDTNTVGSTNRSVHPVAVVEDPDGISAR